MVEGERLLGEPALQIGLIPLGSHRNNDGNDAEQYGQRRGKHGPNTGGETPNPIEVLLKLWVSRRSLAFSSFVFSEEGSSSAAATGLCSLIGGCHLLIQIASVIASGADADH